MIEEGPHGHFSGPGESHFTKGHHYIVWLSNV